MTASTDFDTSSDFETSVLKNIASPPSLLISETVSCPAFSLISNIATLAPSLQKSFEVALPIPEAPPVIIEHLFFNLIS